MKLSFHHASQWPYWVEFDHKTQLILRLKDHEIATWRFGSKIWMFYDSYCWRFRFGHEEDRLEVYLGDGDTAVAAMGDRNGEVGLAILAEIDRPEPHLVGFGADEGGFGRAIGVAPDRIHADPRHVKLLPTVLVEIHQFGDGLDLALQAGFASKTSFNRVFKAQTGMTPSAWRRAKS